MQSRGDYIYLIHSQYEIFHPLSIMTSFLEYYDIRIRIQIETCNVVQKIMIFIILIYFLSLKQR